MAANVQRVFQILAEHPEGLVSNELWEQLALSQSNGSNGNGHSDPDLLSFERLSFACVGPIKAGWLVVERNRWILSTEGREAYENYHDPEELMNQAGKRSSQGWLAVHFPDAYAAAGKTKDQITSEVRTIRRVGLTRLLKETFGKPTPWQEVLPIQAPGTFAVSSVALRSTENLIDYLKRSGASFGEGGHAIYLSPEALKLTAFYSLAENYPPDAGLKIVKNPGNVDQSGYIHGATKGDSRIHLGLVHGHRHLTLVANFLHAMGLGPRLYDLINLKCGDQVWTAYVVQDVDSSIPTLEQCEAGIQKLRELDAEGFIRVILPEGFDDEEFECPTCYNNALVDRDGQFRYIDFQNFLLGDYEKFLTELATEAGAQTHFGDTTVLRGGRYLYQSVPGVNLPAKRSVANRMETINSLLKQAGVSVAGRVVLDVGCNIGMMMSEYLKLGAKWCHGWDRELVTPYTERMLLALGCTRFSTTGGDISRSQPMTADLPAHVARSLEGCAVSYLAIRGHLNWLHALKDLPWSFLIYEGHEGETAEDLEGYLAELKALTNFRVGSVDTYTDGDSDQRTVAILLRRR